MCHVLPGISTLWDPSVTSVKGQMKMSPESGDGDLRSGVQL